MVKTSWNKKVEARKKVLSKLKNSKSFVSYEKLSKSKDNNIHMIHDNGDTPFIVIANSNGIYVYKAKLNELIIKITKYLGYWTGFDSSPYEFHGNSILIQLTENKYQYVGSDIYEFKIEDIITDYISPVGNSDVPYPVAYGSENIYFMLDKKYIYTEELLTPITVANGEDLYGEFYEHLPFVKGRKIKPFKYKIIQERLT